MLLIDKFIIPSLDSESGKAFFLKMKADLYRYLAEFLDGLEKLETAETALSAYQDAQHAASLHLQVTDPIRLGLGLSFSVFYYEVLNDPETAVVTARSAFEDAITALDSVDEKTYKDSSQIMQMLRDNIALWTSCGAAEEEKSPGSRPPSRPTKPT